MELCLGGKYLNVASHSIGIINEVVCIYQKESLFKNLTFSCSIFCITWNVQTGWPEQDLHSLLGIPNDTVIKRSSDDLLPDIYIIG